LKCSRKRRESFIELTNETREIKVNQPVQFVPVTELDNGIIKYSLEEYMEVENDFISSKPVAKVEEVIPEEMNITMKQVSRFCYSRNL
jgi:cell division protein FtsZ